MKFDVDSDFEPPDLESVVGRVVWHRPVDQHSVYVDTPDLRLWELGITLRHHLGKGPASGLWAFELPTPGEGSATTDGSARRSELSWPGAREVVPEPARAIVAGVTRRASLGPVVELETRRQRATLHKVGRTEPWGELYDDQVTVIGGPRDGMHFRQIELELQEDNDGSGPVIEGLRRRGARPTATPELAVALGRRPSPSDDAGDLTGRARRQLTLADTVRASLTASLGRLLLRDCRLRIDRTGADPEDVHQARVTTRRLRSDLRTFGPILDPIWLQHTSEDLRWIGSALGRVRDADVLGGHLHPDPDVEPTSGERRLLARLRDHRHQAVMDLHAALVDPRYFDLLDHLHAAAAAPPVLAQAGHGRLATVTPQARARKAMPVLVRRRWRTLERRVRKAGDSPSDRELHRIRIAAKRLRYAGEAAGPAVGRPARRTAERAERVQTVLGEHHDAAVAAAWLHDQLHAGRLSPEEAFAAGRASSEQDERREALRREWQVAWKDLRRSSRAWMSH